MDITLELINMHFPKIVKIHNVFVGVGYIELINMLVCMLLGL